MMTYIIAFMRKKLLLVLVVIIVLFLGWYGITALSQASSKSKAKETSDTFIKYALANDGANSYKLLSEETKKDVNEKDWGHNLAEVALFFAGQDAKLETQTSTNSTVTVSYTITGTDGNYRFTVILKEEARDWKVSTFSSDLQL